MWLCVWSFLVGVVCSVTTIRNNRLVHDTSGHIVDCHSGNVIRVNNTYYMYGEQYGNSTGFGPSPPQLYPKLSVYTSPDLSNGSWVYGGSLLVDWPTKPYGTFFVPWAVYNNQTGYVVLWFNAYWHGCCEGGWGVARSRDGIHFDLMSTKEEGRYPHVDGNALWVDDDGTAYVIYTSITPGPGLSNHRVSIERLTPDFLRTTKDNYGLFPEDYVEGAMLFKRRGVYYVIYGSCCCFCRAGSGAVVYTSLDIKGPWTRQGHDVNCYPNATSYICGAYGSRVVGDIIIEAQGIGLSALETRDDKGDLTTTFLWQGEQWLSAPHNNPHCPDECRPTTGECAEPKNYIKGHGYRYWLPLEFDDSHHPPAVKPFRKRPEFQLDLP